MEELGLDAKEYAETIAEGLAIYIGARVLMEGMWNSFLARRGYVRRGMGMGMGEVEGPPRGGSKGEEGWSLRILIQLSN